MTSWVGRKKSPKIVFILTDDQDLHMDSLSYMPYLRKHIADKGTTFTRHYCTVALCCPSRVSLWTGKAAHNTNVTDVNPPYGGYPKFISQGFNDDYFPIWMQSLGYATYYVGKLFNAQTIDNYASPPAAGWTGSEFLLDPYTYRYLNATLTRNGGPPVSYEGQYSTDLIAYKSFGFLEDALKQSQPFFLTIAPTAPHSNVQIGGNIDGNFTEHTNVQTPPISAKRHEHLFRDITVPRTPSFNPDTPHGVSWISRLPKQNGTNIASNDHFYRQRLRSLQAVDEMIDELVQRLEKAGILEETYIFFSTDNGYHIGQHRLQPGKQCAFEEDINIPFMVRGPGIAKNRTTDVVTSHIDLVPTFLSLAGGSSDTSPEIWRGFDGAVIPLHHLTEEQKAMKPEHVNVEMWGVIQSEGKYGATLYPNHTYKALRIVGESYNLLYTVWCSGEHELYDLVRDPYETTNIYVRNHSLAAVEVGGRRSEGYHISDQQPLDARIRPEQIVSLDRLIPRLDALIQVLRTCKGKQCTHPWTSLHPNEKISILLEALDSRFDRFYQDQQRVEYDKCEKGYILASEGSIGVRPYLEGIGG
ncbi:related to ARS-1 arylsulfatase [Lecanosticta acicola]|uniref:Arylsulfatase n=1 Tax=Lecanosticta acicola TaxID=111012 RepID=A0AAI9E9Q9_9PEZI|nr:related to ARS-1 arylsulfatase [Lecanosticta acicola]